MANDFHPWNKEEQSTMFGNAFLKLSNREKTQLDSGKKQVVKTKRKKSKESSKVEPKNFSNIQEWEGSLSIVNRTNLVFQDQQSNFIEGFEIDEVKSPVEYPINHKIEGRAFSQEHPEESK